MASVHDFLRSLPEVDEYEHGGLPAFRVRGKRFATMLNDSGVNLFPGEEAIRAATALWPRECKIVHWGDRIAAVRVDHAALDQMIVGELIEEAWASKAPEKLADEYFASR